MTLDPTSSDHRSLRARRSRAAAGFALLVVSLGQVGPSSTVALRPVIAITPDEVIPNGFVGVVYHPSLSARGEAAGVHDEEVRSDAFVQFDVAGPEPMVGGAYGIAVSGDGCVALWTRDNGSADPDASVSFGITDRCDGVEREIATTSTNYDSGERRLALSFDGRFAAVEFSGCFACEFDPDAVARIDTETLEQVFLPTPSTYFGTDASLGLDISDDGNIIATTVVSGPTAADAVVWNVSTGQVTFPGNPGGASTGMTAFPSVSGNGQYVSFASTRNNPAVLGRGPWVFVTPAAGGPLVRVSGATDGAYYTSLSADATQVAYGVGASSGCALGLNDLATLEDECPTTRVDVAYGPAAGFTAGYTVQTISLNTAGTVASGFHIEPELSGNGRWVSWISDNGIDLVGTGDLSRFEGNRQAFLRRRDAGLAISPDPVDFGTIAAGSSAPSSATVTNVGTTTVSLDSIIASPGARFNVVGGGTCAQGSSIAPGNSCTVNVLYSAQNVTATATGTLFVDETGFDPVQATRVLVGRSSSTPPTTLPPETTPSTVVTTTTLPPATTPPTVVTTTVLRPTTTTMPSSVVLDAQPSPVDFGSVAVGIAAPFQTVTVTNVGTAAGTISTGLSGADPGDFFVSEDGCAGSTLPPGESCTITVTMIALAGGRRSAALTLTASGGVGGDVTLTGEGRFAPTLLASPGAVTLRGFTSVIGQGFPPGRGVEVRVVGSSTTFSVVADALGSFRIPVAPLASHLELGAYVLQVDASPTISDVVQAPLAVVLPTFEPQGPGGPAFGDALIVARGG